MRALSHRPCGGDWKESGDASTAIAGKASKAEQGESARCRDIERALIAGCTDALVPGGFAVKAKEAKVLHAIDCKATDEDTKTGGGVVSCDDCTDWVARVGVVPTSVFAGAISVSATKVGVKDGAIGVALFAIVVSTDGNKGIGMQQGRGPQGERRGCWEARSGRYSFGSSSCQYLDR